MQTTLTTAEAMEAIREQAEAIRSDQTQRFPEAASIGDHWRQGDVYITLLGEVPDGYARVSSPQTQLAPGSTQGSRHCLDSLAGVSVFEADRPSMLAGPVIVCDVERTITHPEHGDVIVPPGVYHISYQRNLDAEEREARVRD